MVQLSHQYVTTGKTIALSIWAFGSKVMSLLLNALFVIAFLSRSKYLLILWLQSSSTVILEPKKIKSATVAIFFYLPWSDMTRCHDLSFLNVEFHLHQEALKQTNKQKEAFYSSLLSAIRVVSSAYLVVEISPCNLDSSWWFIQSSISHDVLYIEVK